jgi:hypothetical protein
MAWALRQEPIAGNAPAAVEFLHPSGLAPLAGRAAAEPPAARHEFAGSAPWAGLLSADANGPALAERDERRPSKQPLRT